LENQETLGLANTRTELPEGLYGKDLAIGYSALTREHKQQKVALFQAEGITPAAGFLSNVLDLGKFASGQFRLFDSTVTEILKPSTLKYMQNASGTTPAKYASAIHEILKKAKAAEKKQSPKDLKIGIDLLEYTGNYNPMPWQSELLVSAWYGKLVMLGLPSESPAKTMTLFKHVDGDIFRRIRDDGELGETLVFERNDAGQITRCKNHGNYFSKISR
jgi:hypothetical protein